MLNVEIFNNKDFDIERFITENIKSINLDDLRHNLEELYKFIKNQAIQTTGKQLPYFLNINDLIKNSTDSGESLKLRLVNIQSEFSKCILKYEEKLKDVRLNHQTLREKRTIKDTLSNWKKIYESSEYIKDFMENSGNLSLIYSTPETIEEYSLNFHRCVNIFLEIKELPFLIKIPPILQKYLEPSNAKNNTYKYENDFINLLENHFINLLKNINETNHLLINNKEYSQLQKCMLNLSSLNHINTIEVNLKIYIFEPLLLNFQSSENACVEIIEIFDKLILKLSLKEEFLYKLLYETQRYKFGINILTKSLISAVITRLESRITDISITTDPNQFHSSFIKMTSFLNQLEVMFISNTEKIKLFRQDSFVILLLKKWNILTYFQMRKRFIINQLENKIIGFSLEKDISTDNNLRNSKFLDFAITMLEYCYHPSVFLIQLCGRFWGLFLQIFHFSMNVIRNQLKSLSVADFHVSQLIDMRICLSNYDTKLEGIISDIIKILNSYDINRDSAIQSAYGDMKKSIDDLSQELKTNITQILINEVVQILGQTKNIPRYFRNIIRELPTTPSKFMEESVNRLKEYSTQLSYDILIPSIKSILTQYIDVTNEVCEYMKKTQNSLKLLNEGKYSSHGVEDSGTRQDNLFVNDFSMVMKQLKIDSSFLVEHVKLILTDTSFEELEELFNILEK